MQLAANHQDLLQWWEAARRGKFDEQKKKDIAMSVYVTWHIWKESRRIFESKAKSASVVAELVKADLELLLLAKGGPDGVSQSVE